MRDYYDVLGVSPDAGADEIKRAYRQLARRYHPDISGDDRSTAFLEASHAYQVLTDPRRRRSYDVSRHLPSFAVRPAAADWLADEVAIDFPSVSGLLDSMRHAFFGAALGNLSAEIRLSPLEAHKGTTIPLGIPVRQICPECGGRGETWQEWCDACEGSGDVRGCHRVELRVPPGVREGACFRFAVMPTGSPHTIVDVRISIR